MTDSSHTPPDHHQARPRKHLDVILRLTALSTVLAAAVFLAVAFSPAMGFVGQAADSGSLAQTP